MHPEPPYWLSQVTESPRETEPREPAEAHPPERETRSEAHPPGEAYGGFDEEELEWVLYSLG